MKFIDAAGRVSDPPFAEALEGMPRQQAFQIVFARRLRPISRGATCSLERNSVKGDDCRRLAHPEERAWNIDSPFDLFIVEQMMKYAGAAAAAR